MVGDDYADEGRPNTARDYREAAAKIESLQSQLKACRKSRKK